jgi:hypothetical protein
VPAAHIASFDDRFRRAFWARRRLTGVQGGVPADDPPDVRKSIAAYGLRGVGEAGEQPWGYERRSGADRRRRAEFRYPDRRSGAERRSIAPATAAAAGAEH